MLPWVFFLPTYLLKAAGKLLGLLTILFHKYSFKYIVSKGISASHQAQFQQNRLDTILKPQENICVLAKSLHSWLYLSSKCQHLIFCDLT